MGKTGAVLAFIDLLSKRYELRPHHPPASFHQKQQKKPRQDVFSSCDRGVVSLVDRSRLHSCGYYRMNSNSDSLIHVPRIEGTLHVMEALETIPDPEEHWTRVECPDSEDPTAVYIIPGPWDSHGLAPFVFVSTLTDREDGMKNPNVDWCKNRLQVIVTTTVEYQRGNYRNLGGTRHCFLVVDAQPGSLGVLRHAAITLARHQKWKEMWLIDDDLHDDVKIQSNVEKKQSESDKLLDVVQLIESDSWSRSEYAMVGPSHAHTPHANQKPDFTRTAPFGMVWLNIEKLPQGHNYQPTALSSHAQLAGPLLKDKLPIVRFERIQVKKNTPCDGLFGGGRPVTWVDVPVKIQLSQLQDLLHVMLPRVPLGLGFAPRVFSSVEPTKQKYASYLKTQPLTSGRRFVTRIKKPYYCGAFLFHQAGFLSALAELHNRMTEDETCMHQLFRKLKENKHAEWLKQQWEAKNCPSVYRFFHKESEAMELINQVAAEDKRMKMISYECKGALPERKPSGRDIADLNASWLILTDTPVETAAWIVHQVFPYEIVSHTTVETGDGNSLNLLYMRKLEQQTDSKLTPMET